jgi:hypothetical protein
MGLIFASVMTYYRCLALSASRQLILPDQARYTAVWASIFAVDGAGIIAVDAAASRLAKRCLSDAAVAFAPPLLRAEDAVDTQEAQPVVPPQPSSVVRQFNRSRSSWACAPQEPEEEEYCGEPGTLDPAHPVDNLDQLYVQAMTHACTARTH